MPTYSYKHRQWQLAQSSSSTWCNWQGSWWSSYNSESQEGGEPSLEKEREDPLLTVLWRKPSDDGFHEFNFLLQMDRLQLTAVYCNRRGV